VAQTHLTILLLFKSVVYMGGLASVELWCHVIRMAGFRVLEVNLRNKGEKFFASLGLERWREKVESLSAFYPRLLSGFW
jgi:hypothetical protein